MVKEVQNKEISLIKFVDIVSSRFFTKQSCIGTVKWHGYRIPIIWVYDNHFKIWAYLRGKV